MNARERDEYDHMLDGDEPQPCPVCTGDESAPPCTEECAALMDKMARKRRIRGWYSQALQALLMARIYRSEEGPRSDRERVCLRKVQDCRLHIRIARAAARVT